MSVQQNKHALVQAERAFTNPLFTGYENTITNTIRMDQIEMKQHCTPMFEVEAPPCAPIPSTWIANSNPTSNKNDEICASTNVLTDSSVEIEMCRSNLAIDTENNETDQNSLH
jgi:hypothetical protein